MNELDNLQFSFSMSFFVGPVDYIMLWSRYLSTLLFSEIFSASSAVVANSRFNVSYGNDKEQVLDVYYPTSNSIDFNSKIIILIHGGVWGGGDKLEWFPFISQLQQNFPKHYIANINYRLGTLLSPGYSKQMEDIHSAIAYLKNNISENASFALLGGSAGAHLSLLYSYSIDSPGNKSVKAVVDIMGPTDLVDSSYTKSLNPLHTFLFYNLVGPCSYESCPSLYNKTSPVTYITESSTKTIGFYGDNDFLVPKRQMQVLQEKLDSFGIVNSFSMYSGGHGDWKKEDKEDMMNKIVGFLKTYW